MKVYLYCEINSIVILNMCKEIDQKKMIKSLGPKYLYEQIY